MATMKKAQAGAAIGPKKKPPVSKKPMAPAPKKKSYPIIPDDTTNDGYLDLGPREKTPGGGSSRNGSKISKSTHKMPNGSIMKNSAMSKKNKNGY